MPICIKCQTSVIAPIQEGQDQSTFVCDSCQDLINVKEWESELKDLDKLGSKANSSQSRRANWVRKKLKTVKSL